MTTHRRKTFQLNRTMAPVEEPGAIGPVFTVSRHVVLQAALVLLACVVVLIAADLLLLNLHAGRYPVDIGNFRDKTFLDGAHRQELLDGATYRWTTARATLALAQVDLGPHNALTLTLGGRPTPGTLQLTLNESPWTALTATTVPRRYTLLVPHAAARDWMEVGLLSETFTAAGDNRQLGVRLDGFEWRVLDDTVRFPAVAHLQAQVITLLLLQMTIVRLGWRMAGQAAAGAVAAIGLATVLSSELLLAHSYLPRLAAGAATLALLSWLVLPRLERAATFARPRDLHALWALTLAACGLRLAGVLYPTFSGQDMGFHTAHMTDVATGQLFLITGSTEFGGRAIYPPGVYLSVLPGMLLTEDLRALLQTVLALLDGLTALLVGVLALRLGGDARTAQMALLLYAGSIAALGALNFGFAAQIFGQWFVAPLGLLLLREGWPPTSRTWMLCAMVALLVLCSHAGVAFLVAGWLGLLLAMLVVSRGRQAAGAIAIFAATGMAGFVLLYASAAALMVGNAARQVQGAAAHATGALPGLNPLLISGARLAFSDAGIALIWPGIAIMLLAAPEQRAQRFTVAGAWLAAAAVFLLINVLTTMQVRYFYFALPVALALIALPLGRIAARSGAGRITAWALTLALALPGMALWFQTTMGNGRIPMTPLTH